MKKNALTDPLDAVIAAPLSHKIILENDLVRVLEVMIKPTHKEPPHTHKLPSIMIVDSPTNIRYWNKNDKPIEIKASSKTKVEWLEPEAIHSVENLDKRKTYHAIRIELKNQ